MKRTSIDYSRQNREAASIILAGDPQTFGAGLVEWARAWQSRHGQHGAPTVRGVGSVAQQDGGQMEMFGQAAAEAK